MQDEFYALAFRKNVYDDLEQLQQDLDVYMEVYNTVRAHSGKYGYGKTPISYNNEIRLAAKTNIWGDALLNIKELNKIKDGDEVVVS